MANESTYANISSVISNIFEGALLTARQVGVMPPLVTVWEDTNTSNPRVFSSYTGGTVVTLAEVTDGTAQTFTPAPYGTATVAQYWYGGFFTDQRIASDPFGVVRDFSADAGGLLGKQVDADLVGTFSSFTGGTVGTAGGTLTWADVMKAKAYLQTQNAVGPVHCVLHPMQWYYLTSASSGVPDLIKSPAFMDGLAAGYQASWGGIDFFVSSNITSGTAAVAGMFVPQASYLDVRRALRIEPQRDASRGGGGYEINATMIYAKGVYRPTFGCEMIGTSS